MNQLNTITTRHNLTMTTTTTPSIPSTMRAWQYTSVPSTLESSLSLNPSASLPPTASSLAPNTTLVRVAYTALNPVDYKVPEAPLLARILTFRRPGVPCLDYSGVVVRTTRSDLKPGDRVFGKLEPPMYGAAAEYLVVGAQGCAKLPEGVSFEQAAGVGVAGLTAWQCVAPFLDEAKKARAADAGPLRVFINGGSGGTGTFGVQIAKALGAYVATTCSGGNAEFVRELGADEVIDYRSQDVVARLAELAEKDGVFDLAVDNVGGATPLYFEGHKYLASHAKFVNVGAQPGIQTVVDMVKTFMTPAMLGGGQRTYKFVTCTTNAEQFVEIAQLMQQGKVKTVVERSVKMEEIKEAFERLKTGRVRGKILVKIADLGK